ncbi:MAG: peroxiredoxin [Planctomycetales bacterium]|nr:peroxiredoxin [Planctomycetales bacterium]
MKSGSPFGLLLVAAFVCLSAIALRAADEAVTLKVGDAAPSFEVQTDAGETWKSADHFGKTVVVYFYPAAMTGGCTKQACAYRDDRQTLADKGVEVVAVSGDDVAALALFKKAENLNFALLSDPTGAVAAKFGVPTGAGGEIERVVDGQSHTLKRGVTAKRWTFVVIDGKIAYKNTEVNAAGDSKAILSFLAKQSN